MKNRRNIVELKYPPENPNDIWLKDGKFYRSTSEGWIVIDSKTEYTSKESMIADNPKGGTIGIDKETGEASIYNDVAEQWSPLSGGGVTSITWLELKDKRDNGQLIPGSLYRIIDYNCTTTQENTQSAGHQFDIVLLALSENKLAEEGWAMMNESNVYDVTFADGVTLKCYLYKTNDDGEYNVVITETLLGNSGYYVNDGEDSDIITNEELKTGVATFNSTNLHNENITYNYFQNSNLSAWKVWYCLDNDTARFAWADNRDDASTKACINENLDRNQNLDTEVNGTTYYGWGEGVTSRYTTSEHPEIGDDIYKRRASIGAPSFTVDGTVESYSPEYNGKSTKECIDVHVIVEGLDGLNIDSIYNGVEKIKEPNPSTIVMDGITYYTWGIYGSIEVVTLNRIPKEGDTVYVPRPASTSPTPGQYVMTDIGRVIKYHPEYNIEKGRGVIYRLIDEFNNDIKYDFKNIQFKRKLTDGQYDATNGTETWCYTLNIWYNDMCQDASIVGNTLPNDEGFVNGVYDNKFGYTTAYDFYIEGVNTFVFALGDNVVLSVLEGDYYGIFSNTIGNCFCKNTIGSDFNENTIGNRFDSNTIGNFFQSNTIRDGFSANVIGNDFYNNTIGTGFIDNTIKTTFSSNMVGNDFTNKTINDATSYKNYGNNGVELATKNDIGNIETALSNI